MTRAVPNPFNPRTTLHYDVAQPGRAVLRLYDLRGRLVRVLEDAERAVGRHEAVWDGTDDDGRPVTSGLYLAQLTMGGSVSRLRLVLVR